MKKVLLEKKDNIAYIILNNPEQRNALSIELMNEFLKMVVNNGRRDSSCGSN